MGAAAGFEAGTALLDALGIVFLFAYVSDKLPEVYNLLRKGLRRGWEAPDSPYGLEDFAIDAAARDIARDLGVLFSLILQAIVSILTAKGASRSGVDAPHVPACTCDSISRDSVDKTAFFTRRQVLGIGACFGRTSMAPG